MTTIKGIKFTPSEVKLPVIIMGQLETPGMEDRKSWTFAFDGWFGPDPERAWREGIGLRKQWIVQPESNTRQSAAEALAERAAKFGFNEVSVFEATPPMDAQLKKELDEFKKASIVKTDWEKTLATQ